MKNFEVTEKLARKVRDVVKVGLSCGLGRPKPGEMCVEAAVCYALGQHHGDKPECVHEEVRSAKIRLNDQRWSSRQARADGLLKVAIAQLGSLNINGNRFNSNMVNHFIRTAVPKFLQLHGFEREANAFPKMSNVRRCRCLDELARNSKTSNFVVACETARYTTDQFESKFMGMYRITNLIADFKATRKTKGDPDFFLRMAADSVLYALRHSPGYKYLYLVQK